MQIKASLHRLQAIAEEEGVARLVLLLKEMISDYNPGSALLKRALSTKPYYAGSAKVSASRQPTEPQVAVTQPTPSAAVNWSVEKAPGFQQRSRFGMDVACGVTKSITAMGMQRHMKRHLCVASQASERSSDLLLDKFQVRCRLR
jgi:hypothetical protein